jgi:zinc protease
MKKVLSSFAVIFLMSANAFAQNIPVDPSVRIGTFQRDEVLHQKKYITGKESRFQTGN